MEYSVEDFNPSKPILTIAGVEYEIGLLTLHAEARLTEKFGDINKIFEVIKKNPLTIFQILWILTEDKKLYSNSQVKFQNALLSSGATLEVTKESMNAINKVFIKSAPIIRNRKKYDEMLKLKMEQEDNKICYGVYYDRIAKRYGYSINEFYNLTLRQLHILLTVSDSQNYQDLEVQAALQGKKLKTRLEFDDRDEKEDKALDDEAIEVHKRMMKEYNDKKGKKI